MKESTKKYLTERIQNRSFSFGVIGLGYVGLPLAVEFAKQGVRTTGFDIDESKVENIGRGKSYIQDVKSQDLSDLSEHLTASTNMSGLTDMDVISICVPTPLNKTKDPNMSYVFSAIQSVKQTLRPGQLIILESTTYPGTTEELLKPILEETGLVIGEDVFLAFSPERVDPGNTKYHTVNTPKVIGGSTESCTDLAKLTYEVVINTVVPVSSTSTAELVKLYENMFRAVNIALANEMAIMCNKLGVSVWEVIEAAATKPFGFMPFYPGPGLGGHCIPIDPHYLSWKMKTLNYDAKFIGLAAEVNQSMPGYVVERVTGLLNDRKKAVNGSKITVMGVAYKQNINDSRESPAIEIISGLKKRGAEVQYHDSYIPQCKIQGETFSSVPCTPDLLASSDLVLILAAHDTVDWDAVLAHSTCILDTRNCLGQASDDKVNRL